MRSSSHRSLGHLSWMARDAGSRPGSRPPPATARTSRRGASGRPSEKVSESPAPLCQPRPSRPRPAVCCSATSSTGSRCARPGPGASVRCCWSRSRGRISTVKPGNSGATASQTASAGQITIFLLPLPALGRQQRAAAVLGAAPAGILGLELLGVRLVDDQAVVVVELFAGLDVAQGLDEDPAVLLVGLAVRVAGVVDPARGIAADLARRSPGRRRCGSRRYGSGLRGSCGWRRSASFQVMTSPTYSMSVSPSAMSCTAKTPLPWTPERRTWILRIAGLEASRGSVARLTAFAGIAENSVSLNMHTVRVRTRARSADCKDRAQGRSAPDKD